MHKRLSVPVMSLGLLALFLSTSARAQDPIPAPSATPAKAGAPPTKTEGKVVPLAAKPEAPPAEMSRGDLLEQLKKAKDQLAQDKKAAAEAKKGGDKATAQAAQDKIKADGRTIHDLELRLQAQKGKRLMQPKRGAEEPGAEKPAL